jgi:hypothetical protein
MKNNNNNNKGQGGLAALCVILPEVRTRREHKIPGEVRGGAGLVRGGSDSLAVLVREHLLRIGH